MAPPTMPAMSTAHGNLRQDELVELESSKMRERMYAPNPYAQSVRSAPTDFSAYMRQNRYLGDMRKYTGGKSSCAAWSQPPASLSRLYITSASDPSASTAAPSTIPTARAGPHTVRAYNFLRKFARRMLSYCGKFARVRARHATRAGASNGPVQINAPDLKYSTQDDGAGESEVVPQLVDEDHKRSEIEEGEGPAAGAQMRDEWRR
ncbi:uncharacterized protein BXZ73DRAFT_75816 [Epithele typhae]|uniref:uncharacterized protein n=1 Tax=Epithele typhae TaxID=378194 RepID=UPI002007460F|nr:uncharacterized protein BXZ73DRAFT_75816 [Epithele typhae]KAH9939608.1 hypothetical protein BXZ73DRAFT_75816 [Epithele typhae]